MKRALRNTAALILCAPVIVLTYFRAFFQGKAKAMGHYGPALTRMARRSLRYWVPAISDAAEFDLFRKRMKNNLRWWRILYDIDIAEDAPGVHKVHVNNCPFCEVLSVAGLGDLNASLCKADWKVAEDNSGKWIFQRQHTIGSGDALCDHTYRRIEKR